MFLTQRSLKSIETVGQLAQEIPYKLISLLLSDEALQTKQTGGWKIQDIRQ